MSWKKGKRPYALDVMAKAPGNRQPRCRDLEANVKEMRRLVEWEKASRRGPVEYQLSLVDLCYMKLSELGLFRTLWS